MNWHIFRIDYETVCERMGVGPGDRVGICMRKSADAVASIFGIMKAGAAYVPTDPTAPASRNAFIFHNCAVKVVIVESRLADRLNEEFKQLGFAPGDDCHRWSRRGSPAHQSSRPARRRQPRSLGSQCCSRPFATGLHPLHLGLNRPAKRCYAIAC